MKPSDICTTEINHLDHVEVRSTLVCIATTRAPKAFTVDNLLDGAREVTRRKIVNHLYSDIQQLGRKLFYELAPFMTNPEGQSILRAYHKTLTTYGNELI